MSTLSKFQQSVYPAIATSTVNDLLLSELLINTDTGVVNPFHPKFVAILGLPRLTRHVYQHVTPVTTQAFAVWGTTSLWPVMVACSDYIHPHEIPDGELLLLPSVQDMFTLLKTKNKDSVAGKVITF